MVLSVQEWRLHQRPGGTLHPGCQAGHLLIGVALVIVGSLGLQHVLALAGAQLLQTQPLLEGERVLHIVGYPLVVVLVEFGFDSECILVKLIVFLLESLEIHPIVQLLLDLVHAVLQ